MFHIPGVWAGEKTVGSAASASGARAAGARRPLAGDICPGSQAGGERARCGGQAPRPGAAGARARGGRLPGHCAPADFHGRLPRSRRRRPGVGLSPGFKRHSRNVNNPGRRAGWRERAGAAGPGPPPPPPLPGGQPNGRAAQPLPLYLPQTFSSSSAFLSYLSPLAGHRARASPEAGAQSDSRPAPDPGGLVARPLLGCPPARLPGSRELPWAVPE